MPDMIETRDAPGRPGVEPRWTTSAKTGVGAAIQGVSRVAFTLSHGILNEIYFPRHDEACLRDMGLIVTNGRDYCSEEKRDTHSVVTPIADGVPGYRVVNTARDGRYAIEKRVIADPQRDVVLQKITFRTAPGHEDDYRLFAPPCECGGEQQRQRRRRQGLGHADRHRQGADIGDGRLQAVPGDLRRLRGRQ